MDSWNHGYPDLKNICFSSARTVQLAHLALSLSRYIACCRTMMSQSARAVSFAAVKTRNKALLGRSLALSLLREEKNNGGSRRTIAMASTTEEYLMLEDRCE